MRAVVFDMDGLMFDTERLAMAAWDYAGEKLGVGKAGYMVMKTLGVTAERADEIWRENSAKISTPRPCAATAESSSVISMSITKFP